MIALYREHNHRQWDIYLLQLTFAVISSRHDTITKYTPISELLKSLYADLVSLRPHTESLNKLQDILNIARAHLLHASTSKLVTVIYGTVNGHARLAISS